MFVVLQVSGKIALCNMALISGVYDHVTKMLKVAGINRDCFVVFLSEKKRQKKETNRLVWVREWIENV